RRRRAHDHPRLALEVTESAAISYACAKTRGISVRPEGFSDCISTTDEGPMRDAKDHDLLERLQDGDQDAVAELATAYGSKIYQLAFRYLRNKEDAEEVMQDVLFKVYRSSGAFRGDAALSSWIYRITFNAAMSRLRTASYQRAQDADRQMAAESDQMAPA